MIIAICDDDKIWCRKAQNIIKDYGKKIDLTVEILCFTDHEELMNYVGLPIDVLFMDIELNKTSGINIVSHINKKWEKCQIVYLTNYLFYAVDVYDTKHVFYVLKEQFSERIGGVFEKILHEMENRNKSLIFTCRDGQRVFLAPEEIYYFERLTRKTVIKTVWGDYEIKERIDEIISRISMVDFIRCHNSYVVYLPNVKEVDKTDLIMKNGDKILISRGYAKEARAGINRWILMQL